MFLHLCAAVGVLLAAPAPETGSAEAASPSGPSTASPVRPPAAAAPISPPATASPISPIVPPVQFSDSPETRPPPGSREDQALWTSGRDAQTGSLLEQARTRRLHEDVRAAKLQDRLAALRGSGGHEVAEEAGERLEKLEAAADEAYRVASAPPFDLRTGCRYEIIRLGQAMDPANPASRDIAQARKDLSTCRDALDRYRKPLQGANDRLEAAIAKATALLARSEPASTTGPEQARSGPKP